VSSIHASGCNCIGFGEMGIGNSSAAALIMAVTTGTGVEDCIGKGTGTNEEQLNTKIKTLLTVYNKHVSAKKNITSALDVLSAFGGFEIAMMTGAYLEAAKRKMVIVVDGFISTAALLVAQQ